MTLADRDPRLLQLAQRSAALSDRSRTAVRTLSADWSVLPGAWPSGFDVVLGAGALPLCPPVPAVCPPCIRPVSALFPCCARVMSFLRHMPALMSALMSATCPRCVPCVRPMPALSPRRAAAVLTLTEAAISIDAPC